MKISWQISIFFLYFFSSNMNAFDCKSCDDTPQDEAENNPSPSPPGTLPNFEVYSLIECLKPGEVLLNEATENCLNASGLFNDFFVVSYQSGRYKDAFYFVPKKMTKDAEKALSLYSKSNPGFYAYLIPVKDDGKFLELAAKTSAGYANKNGIWVDDVDWQNLNKVFSGGYTMLDRNRIAYAMAVPKQGDDQKNRSWSCGPNSAYRALRCFGQEAGDFDNFVENCPKTISKEVMINTGVGVGVAGTILGVLFAPFTGGLSLVAGAAVHIAGMATSITGGAISSDVGPRPAKLASYISEKMKGRAQFSGYSAQTDCEKALLRDIRGGYPRIVLLISGTLSMHYVVVIGVKPMGDFINQAVILDTDGTIGVISDKDLGLWMDRDGYANGLLAARYNTIEFFRE